MKKHITFSEQGLKCRVDGTSFHEKCPSCSEPIIMCKKHGGMCKSSKCRKERERAAESEDVQSEAV